MAVRFGSFLLSLPTAALALEGVHDVQGRDRLALGVVRVGDSVANDTLQKYLQHATNFLVDEAIDAFDTAAARQAADSGLGNALNVVTQHRTMALGAALSEAHEALATTRHVDAVRNDVSCQVMCVICVRQAL